MGLTMDLKGGFPRVATTKKTLVSVGSNGKSLRRLKIGCVLTVRKKEKNTVTAKGNK